MSPQKGDRHRVAVADRDFQRAFEGHQIPAGEFDHRAHVRLAYVYLCAGSTELAKRRMERSLLGFLEHLGVDRSKYHETLTEAWTRAVAHFMKRSTPCSSADEFIDRNPKLLDPEIMLQHYSAELLFSADARRRWVDPDVEPIPEAGPAEEAR